ncbi:GntR family transcriptional regulator [Ideonella azotifigens]|uniref:GntR family transcriptional regulator n=2 Tax=Ideonella azotifigens TaxID=513160 RepID=A0ABN1KEH9_9BURK
MRATSQALRRALVIEDNAEMPTHVAHGATRRRQAGKAEAADTATQRVYQGIYQAIIEHRLAPGARLREEELAESFSVSRTVVRQALQRLAADQIIVLQHNRGAQVPHPDLAHAAHVFDARRVVECDIARRLAGKLSAAQVSELNGLVQAEAAAHVRGDAAAAIRLSGRFHQALAELVGNPVFIDLIDELLPTTSLLIALYQRGDRPGCVTHRHQELIAALTVGTPAQAAAEMRRHLTELEKSLVGGQGGTALRDVFAPYREASNTSAPAGEGMAGAAGSTGT